MQENQDRAAILTGLHGDNTLLVVADGLGGHSGAALAAQTVVDTSRRVWAADARYGEPEVFLRRLAIEAHAAINQAGRAAGLDPRTTIAAFLVSGSQAVSVHAGDSRVMQLGPTGLVKQTVDHSIGKLKVLAGSITEEELATHPDQKKLFTHLGGREDPHLEITRWAVSSGDRFVVCSDGFWEIFTVPEMQSLFEADDPANQVATRFREKLASLESHDNTTAILAQIATAPSRVWYWSAVAALVFLGLTVALWPNSEPSTSGTRGRALAEERGLASAARSSQGVQPTGRIRGSSETALSPPIRAFAAQAPAEEDRASETEGGRSRAAIPNEPVNLKPDLTVPEGESTAAAVVQVLQDTGRIGANDSLKQRDEPRSLGNTRNERLQQTHRDIPVYAAEVVVTTNGNRIVSILGHTAAGIEVAPDPPNDYEETLALAQASNEAELEPAGQASLVILPVEDGYRLCWLGIVAVDGIEERLVIDAATGEILVREPVTIG